MSENRWNYVAAVPSATVRSRGCAFGGFSERSPRPISRLEPAAATGVMILSCGEPFSLRPALSPGLPVRLSAFVAGLQTPAQVVTHSGSNDCVEIRLPPLSMFALFGGAMVEPNCDPVDLFDLQPQAIGRLLHELRSTSSWPVRLAAIDRFLAVQFAQSRCRIPPEVACAWDALHRTRGQMPMHELARHVGWSERHLIEQFRAHVGVRPKQASRALRFSSTRDMLSALASGDLSTIAAQAGFSDQSHMTREIQAFSGLTPGLLRTAKFADLPGIPASALSSR